MKKEAQKALPTGSEKKSQYRLNILLPKVLIDRVDMAAKETGEPTRTAVIKAATRLYFAAIEAHRRGEQLIFKNKDGTSERTVDIEAGIF